MNDEIKEILSDMLHIICKYGDDFDDLEENEIRYQLPYTKMEKLYDYITNLQEERDKYKMRCYKANKMIWDNYGVLDKYEIEMLEDILDGRSDE